MANAIETLSSVDVIEAEALISVIQRAYGYDFSNYAPSSQIRRLRRTASHFGFNSLSQLQHALLHDPHIFGEFLSHFNVSVTEFFRDEGAFQAVAREVLPYLRTFPQFKIWHAGCASGEEVYSLAVMLNQADTLERARLYGTDISPRALATAREGVYDASAVHAAQPRYATLGYGDELASHFSENYDAALIKGEYRKRVLFSDHNLATDGNFGTFQVIFCRNVIIYFDEALQTRTLKLFNDALDPGGYLCLGQHEVLPQIWLQSQFECVDADARIYRKRRRPSLAL